MVSQYGRVKSVDRFDSSNRFLRGKMLKQHITIHGYPCVNLHKNNKLKSCRIHILVAAAFKNYQYKNHLKIIDHIDGNRLNSKLSNLQIISQRQNVRKDVLKNKKSKLPVGVFKDKNKYRSSIYIDNKLRYLGTFCNIADAELAYKQASHLVDTGNAKQIKFATKSERKHKLPTGVFKNKKRFMARIRVNGQIKYLGTFDTPEEASAVYQKEKRKR